MHSPVTMRRSRTQEAQAAESTAATREGYAPAAIDIEDVKAQVEAMVQSAFDRGLSKPQRRIGVERAEVYQWWDLFAIGPFQFTMPGGPLLPHSVIKSGETAFVATILVLNPSLALSGGTNAGDVLSNFALPYEVKYQTGNLTSWTLGPAGMNAANSGSLVPGAYFYVDVLSFSGMPPGMYEMNISARILGAAPPYVNAPQFAGFATAVINIDNAIETFLSGVPGVPGPGPIVEYDQPVRFLVYP